MKHQYHAFFCGCFTARASATPASIDKLGWKRNGVGELAGKLKNTYYEDFLRFCDSDSHDDGCISWQLPLGDEELVCPNPNRQKSNTEKKESYVLHVPALHCYWLPFNLVIFAIEVTQESESLDDFQGIAYYMRRLSCPEKIEEKLWKMYEAFTGKPPQNNKLYHIQEYGYNLKVFQIIDTDADPEQESEEERRRLLYRLGTFQREKEDGGFCEAYVVSSLRKHKLSIWKNWDALALLDSFTIRSFKVPDRFKQIWCEQYYRLIFIQSIFQKYYLQNLNRRFRLLIGSRRDDELELLLQEFETYERICQFNKVAYTFAPLLVDEAIDTALEIREERSQLTEHIAREQKRHEAENEKKVNRFLVAISALAAFSAIWDLTCLFNEISPYRLHFCVESTGYLAVSSTLLTAVILVMLFMIYWNRRPHS